MSISFFKIVLICHIASVVIGMGTAVFMHMQFIRKTIKWGHLREIFHFASRIIWLGLAATILTGIILWTLKTKAVHPLFYGKLALVAMLIIDGIIIHFIGKPRLNLLRADQGFLDLPKQHKRAFYFSGFLSFLGWWGAFVIAFLI